MTRSVEKPEAAPTTLLALRDKIRGLTSPDREDDYYSQARRLEYEIARAFPPMADPRPFSRDACDDATFDHVVKMDIYDGIPAFVRSSDASQALCERLLPAWQWAQWGGAIEVGNLEPRCLAHVSDGQQVFNSADCHSRPAHALLDAILTALLSKDDPS